MKSKLTNRGAQVMERKAWNNHWSSN